MAKVGLIILGVILLAAIIRMGIDKDEKSNWAYDQVVIQSKGKGGDMLETVIAQSLIVLSALATVFYFTKGEDWLC